MVTFKGIEHLDAARKEGKGAILVSSHFGNWELYAASIAAAGYPFVVVVYEQHNSLVEEQLNRIRRMKGVEIIYKGDAARGVLRALAQNKFVAMLADQDAGQDGVFVNFMGRPASVTKGPAVFAIKTGAPLLTGVIVREGPSRHTGYIGPLTHADASNRKDQEIKRLSGQFTAVLEGYVRAHPDHWYWVHKRWKTRPRE
jgi:Kdo2-lipid IVA lauroyltransferase/acyltransferase